MPLLLQGQEQSLGGYCFIGTNDLQDAPSYEHWRQTGNPGLWKFGCKMHVFLLFSTICLSFLCATGRSLAGLRGRGPTAGKDAAADPTRLLGEDLSSVTGGWAWVPQPWPTWRWAKQALGGEGWACQCDLKETWPQNSGGATAGCWEEKSWISRHIVATRNKFPDIGMCRTHLWPRVAETQAPALANGSHFPVFSFLAFSSRTHLLWTELVLRVPAQTRWWGEALGNQWTSCPEGQVGAPAINWINTSEAVVFELQANKKDYSRHTTWHGFLQNESFPSWSFLKFLKRIPATPAVKPNVSGNIRSKACHPSTRKMDPQGNGESFENRKSACASLVLYASFHIPSYLKLPHRTFAGSARMTAPCNQEFCIAIDQQKGLGDAQQIFTEQTNERVSWPPWKYPHTTT